MNKLWMGLFGAVLLLGCPPGSSGTPDAGPSQLGCKEVLDCSAACSASDDGGCTDACVARATPSAKDQLTALVQCDQTNGCNSDESCLQSKCATEIAACVSLVPGDGGTEGGGGDDFPKKYVGKVTDSSNLGGMQLDSTGDAVFVRDDQADPRGQSGTFAFYRLESITYVAKASGSTGPCTYSANETVTFTNPPAFENLVAIKKTPNGQGAYEYDITTTLSQKRPGAMTTTCNPGGTSQSDFNAENNVAAGVPAPTTNDKRILKANAQGTTRWSWDLKGVN